MSQSVVPVGKILRILDEWWWCP